MPNKQFEHCKVCRLNHNQGKGHKFTTRHRQRLDSHLSKALAKIEDISFFLSNPALLRQSDRAANSFWCSFCDTTVTELDSAFVCSNTLRHLASPPHLDAVKKFCYENGVEVEKRHLYAIQPEELAKWEDACKALSAASTSMEISHGAVNNIRSACSSNVATSFETFSVACCKNTDASGPLPLYKDGNSFYNAFEKRSLVHDGAGVSTALFIPQNIGAASQIANSNLEQHLGLTCIRLPSSGSLEGNVHTGAPPPWLQIGDNKTGLTLDAHAPSPPLSRSKQKQVKKLRNPQRVGAAWADKRRAEMEREATGECLQRGVEADKGWLPNFGGVWQSGSRRETRKEFEAQKVLGLKTFRSEKTRKEFEDQKFFGLDTFRPEAIKAVQPYISKRQRLKDENADVGGSS